MLSLYDAEMQQGNDLFELKKFSNFFEKAQCILQGAFFFLHHSHNKMTEYFKNQLSTKTKSEIITSAESIIAFKSINPNMMMCCCMPLNWPEHLYHIA
jgi:hypothetical protein